MVVLTSKPSDVEILIQTHDGKNLTLRHGTGVKLDMETNTSTTATFDEVIPQGTTKIPHTVEIDRVKYDDRETYRNIKVIMDDMVINPGNVTIREVQRIPGETPFVIVRNYTSCLIDGKSLEIKPEERTVENLKWKCGALDEYDEDYTY